MSFPHALVPDPPLLNAVQPQFNASQHTTGMSFPQTPGPHTTLVEPKPIHPLRSTILDTYKETIVPKDSGSTSLSRSADSCPDSSLPTTQPVHHSKGQPVQQSQGPPVLHSQGQAVHGAQVRPDILGKKQPAQPLSQQGRPSTEPVTNPEFRRKTPKRITSNKRTTTGCLTCKKRKVKCDQRRPY